MRAEFLTFVILMAAMPIPGRAADGDGSLIPWPPERSGALILVPELMVAGAADGTLEIGGSAVGGGALPSQFYLDARAVIESPTATEAQFMELSRHANQGIRTVGMAGLAERGGETAIARLKELLSSRESACGMPGGCLAAWIHEADTAWQFLTGTNYLCLKRQEPLLDARQRLALAVELLYRDDTAGLRGLPWNYWRRAPHDCLADEFLSGRMPMSLEALRRLAPAVPDYLLVKAMGRLHPRLVTGFLLQMAQDKAADPQVRLAAASALLHGIWRDSEYFDSSGLFASLEKDLDALHPGSFGGRFHRISLKSWSSPLSDWKSFDDRNRLNPGAKTDYARIFRVITMNGKDGLEKGNEDHSPVLLAMGLVREQQDRWVSEAPWEELAAYLEAHASAQRLWREDWNAFADTWDMLEILVRRLPRPEYGDPVPEAGKNAILRAVQKIRELPAGS